MYVDHLSSCSGRTFPTHQYFSAQLGAGQLSLYNLLKAYSLLDTEVHVKILFPLHHCRRFRVWWITLLSLAPHNLLLFHHQGWLLSGYQLCSRTAAASHERGAGLWHAEVPHVWPGHQAAVQARHDLSAGECTDTSHSPAEKKTQVVVPARNVHKISFSKSIGSRFFWDLEWSSTASFGWGKKIIPTSIKDKWTPIPQRPTAPTTFEKQIYPSQLKISGYFHLFFLLKLASFY